MRKKRGKGMIRGKKLLMFALKDQLHIQEGNKQKTLFLPKPHKPEEKVS